MSKLQTENLRYIFKIHFIRNMRYRPKTGDICNTTCNRIFPFHFESFATRRIPAKRAYNVYSVKSAK